MVTTILASLHLQLGQLMSPKSNARASATKNPVVNRLSLKNGAPTRSQRVGLRTRKYMTGKILNGKPMNTKVTRCIRIMVRNLK